jgi:class 3 adenylate cyclase
VDIAAWLQGLGLERYVQAFQDNEIDARSLPHLTADDLKELGVTAIGHRRLLLEAIADLKQSGTPAVEGVPEGITPSNGVGGAAQAERRQLTVMFADMVSSTELSSRLDPEDMGQVIRAYQDCCADAVKRWNGHVAKFMGDGVLVYFGYPQAHEDDAERSVRAGLELTGAVGRLAVPYGETLAARVGIATGLVMVGDLVGEGSADKDAVVGETPNLAARLQALAAPGQVAQERQYHQRHHEQRHHGTDDDHQLDRNAANAAKPAPAHAGLPGNTGFCCQPLPAATMQLMPSGVLLMTVQVSFSSDE